jgi:hypothetical protein
MSSAEHPVNDNVEPAERKGPEWTVSRRRLLKALVAAGGTVAASTLLPSKWTKPVVEVGVLPAHAQATPSAAPTAEPEYSAVCDSTPGGGDITGHYNLPSGSGRIESIEPYLIITSGTGSVEGIVTTMEAEAVPPTAPLPSFNPTLPRTAITDAGGVADFGTLNVTGTAGQSFNLRFTFATPTGTPPEVLCGQYDLH